MSLFFVVSYSVKRTQMFIHSTTNQRLGGFSFWLLQVVFPLDILLSIFEGTYISIFVETNPRSGIAESWAVLTLRFCRYCSAVFQKICVSLWTCHLHVRVPFAQRLFHFRHSPGCTVMAAKIFFRISLYLMWLKYLHIFVGHVENCFVK